MPKSSYIMNPRNIYRFFCLFAVYEEDCLTDENGNEIISLSAEKQKTIRDHFPNADSVGIICNPKQFLDDVIKSIGTRVEHGVVYYFHIDKGFEVNDGKQTAMDMEYMKYLVQDVPPVIENGMKKYSFVADYVYRVLFCKDVFFTDEQEYRIVLPDEKIKEGTRFSIELSDPINVLSLDTFFNKTSPAE